MTNPIEGGLEATPEGGTRRDFLVSGAAALALAYGLPDFAEAAGRQRLTPRHQRTAAHMIKGLNTPYFAPALTGSHDTVNFVRNGGAEAVVIWAPPLRLTEPHQGEHDESPWRRFHKDVAAASTVAEVYVAIPCDYPKWAVLGHRQAPKDRGPQSPLAEHARQVHERYPDARAIIPFNEPNLAFILDKKRAAHTAEMIIMMDKVLYDAGYRGKVLVPATADEDSGFGVPFNHKVLKHLGSWKPFSDEAWATHMYQEVKLGTVEGTRANLGLLDKQRWPGGVKIWGTENGYRFATHRTSTRWKFDYDGPLASQEAEQVRNLVRHYQWCRRSGKIAMWANYTLSDSAWGGNGFMSGLKRTDGTPHPAYEKWMRL